MYIPKLVYIYHAVLKTALSRCYLAAALSFGIPQSLLSTDPGGLMEQWYAVYVHSQREASVRDALSAKGYEVFFPYYSVQTHRMKSVWKALFPRYLFCRLTTASTGKIVTTPGVVKLVGDGRLPHPIDDWEIQQIKAVLDSDLPRYPWKYFVAEAVVEITTGPLTGVRGMLIGLPPRRKLVVAIRLLNRSVAVELDQDTALRCSNGPLTEL